MLTGHVIVTGTSMDATIRLLDAVKRKLGISSDYALAKRWGIGQQVVSRYRTGTHTLGDEKAIELAGLIGADPVITLLEIQAERAASGGRVLLSSVLADAAERLRCCNGKS